MTKSEIGERLIETLKQTESEKEDERAANEAARMRYFFIALSVRFEADAKAGDEEAAEIFRECCRVIGHRDWIEEAGL